MKIACLETFWPAIRVVVAIDHRHGFRRPGAQTATYMRHTQPAPHSRLRPWRFGGRRVRHRRAHPIASRSAITRSRELPRGHWPASILALWDLRCRLEGSRSRTPRWSSAASCERTPLPMRRDITPERKPVGSCGSARREGLRRVQVAVRGECGRNIDNVPAGLKRSCRMWRAPARVRCGETRLMFEQLAFLRRRGSRRSPGSLGSSRRHHQPLR